MKVVPVAHQREDQQHESNEQQSGGLRRIDGMAMMRVEIVVTGTWHELIVALRRTQDIGDEPNMQPPVLHYVVVAQNKARTLHFGVFELDLSAGELRKSGVKLRLQGQPIQVLTLLLERPGDVVTREELRQKLWPSDTFVDFDHSVNTAINKVRDALGDSASSPRYVETLARRGYRFIAPVENGTRDASSSGTAATASQPGAPTFLHPELEVPVPHRGFTRALFLLIQAMYLSFYLAALFRLHAIESIADSFLAPWQADGLTALVLITGGVGIPLRCYLISAVGFDHRLLGEKFRRIFLFVLALDELWAIAPFLLIQKIGIGAAFAACAALVYVPFSERTLVRLAYVERTAS